MKKLKLLAALFIVTSLVLYLCNNQIYSKSVLILNGIGTLIFGFAVYKDFIKNRK